MKTSWFRVALTVVGVVVLCVLVWGVSVATRTVDPVEPTAPVYLISDFRHPTPTPEPTLEPAPEEAPVVETPVEEAPVEEAPYSNSGEAVPFIPSDDPNNANGGDYIDPGVYCTSGSASGFPPVCD